MHSSLHHFEAMAHLQLPNGMQFYKSQSMKSIASDEVEICNGLNCYKIQSMISALIFYSTIDPINDKKDEAKFMEYFLVTYPEVLDDYTHIMTEHQDDIHEIHQKMIQYKSTPSLSLWDSNTSNDLQLIQDCNIQNCMAIRRHFRDRENRKSKWKCQQCSLMNPPNRQQCQACFADSNFSFNLIFYVDLMDSLHCFWYHAYDLGIRINRADVSITKDEGRKNEYYDEEFSIRNRFIRRRLQTIDGIEGLKNRFQTNKFALDKQSENRYLPPEGTLINIQ